MRKSSCRLALGQAEQFGQKNPKQRDMLKLKNFRGA